MFNVEMERERTYTNDKLEIRFNDWEITMRSVDNVQKKTVIRILNK